MFMGGGMGGMGMMSNDFNQMPMGQGGFTPTMSYANYNNIAAASFYSHQPLGGHTSGYLGSFGAPMGIPLQRHPLDNVGYGSFTMNFRNPPLQPTFYSDTNQQNHPPPHQPLLSFRA
jgi:hypothetical protein